MRNACKSRRKYSALACGAGESLILAPNGREVARCHTPRTTRRVLAVMNGAPLSDSDQLRTREHSAPIERGYPIMSGNGRMVVSCTSRHVQLRLSERLNERTRRIASTKARVARSASANRPPQGASTAA